MIAADFRGVKASGRCIAAYNLRVLRSLLMTGHLPLLCGDGPPDGIYIKTHESTCTPLVACVKFSTNNTFAATVSQKLI
jgi:hypothetical protein